MIRDRSVKVMRMRGKLTLWAELFKPTPYVLISLLLGIVIVKLAGTQVLSHYPTAAIVFLYGMSVLVGFGALWCLWLFTDAARFIHRHYRIRQLPPKEYWKWRPGPKVWVYEEWTPTNGICHLPFVRELIENGYPAATIVRLPSESAWEGQMPDWTKGRRTEIIQRIFECAGPRTKFVDL